MSAFDNYPDDIRSYDHDPRSPFYNGPDESELGSFCQLCGKHVHDEEEIFSELCDECYQYGLELGEDEKEEVIDLRKNGTQRPLSLEEKLVNLACNG